MKKIYLLFTTTLAVLFISMNIQQASPAEKIQQDFRQGLQSLIQQIRQFEQKLATKNIGTLKKAYSQMRQQFKKIEFLLAYLDPQAYEKHINESPLLKPKPFVANKEIHLPGGFQVIDEVLYNEQPDFGQLQQLSKDLLRHLQAFQQASAPTRLHDALILHAAKAQLLRSFTLGVSGFDSPGSVLAMEDLQAVHQSLNQVFKHYENYYPKTKLNALIQTLNAVNYSSFEEFDRYAYLTQQVIPALQLIEEIRKQQYLETLEELNAQPLAINSRYTNPFQPDFLNLDYYSQIPEKERTTARIQLGESLFNNTYLSKNLQTSCASCHQKRKVFTDGLARSQTSNKKGFLARNSPSLNYAIYAEAFFHDLRAKSLGQQFEHVIHSDGEFNSSYGELIEKLKAREDYASQFWELYSNYPLPISKSTINHALVAYLSSLPAFNSTFDQYVQQQKQDIPADVRQGFNLFMGKAACGTCHFPPTFAGLVPPHFEESESEVLGVLKDENFVQPVLDEDEGRAASGVVKEDFDFYQNSFKTPSLRNVAQTAPYMHNGSISSLEKVVEFYDLGGGKGMGLPLEHQTLSEAPLELSEQEKKALIAFMRSLSDQPEVD